MQKWQSMDETVTKELIQKEGFTEMPTERAICRLQVSNLAETDISLDKLKEKYPSDIIYNSSEITYILGDACSELDRKIERAIEHMFINETSLITVKLSDNENNDEIIVKFELTLVNFEGFKQLWKWTPEEKFNISLKYKEAGVQLFKSSRYVDAFFKFSRACKILITLEPLKDLELKEDLLRKINNLRLILYNNMAECHLHRKNYEHVVTLCNKVLERDHDNVKALYRRAVASGNLDNFNEALEDLRKVLKLEPNNSLAKEKFKLFRAQNQEVDEKYEHFVKRMFGYEK